jgi:putative transposase
MAASCDEFEAYGWRRIRAACGNGARRLMREDDLQSNRRRRDVATTDNDRASPIFPGLTKDAVPDGSDQLWSPT